MREPTTAAEYAAIEAAGEAALHGDDHDQDAPDLHDQTSFGATGPGEHTCSSIPGITCFGCLAGVALPVRGAA